MGHHGNAFYAHRWGTFIIDPAAITGLNLKLRDELWNVDFSISQKELYIFKIIFLSSLGPYVNTQPQVWMVIYLGQVTSSRGMCPKCFLYPSAILSLYKNLPMWNGRMIFEILARTANSKSDPFFKRKKSVNNKFISACLPGCWLKAQLWKSRFRNFRGKDSAGSGSIKLVKPANLLPSWK